MESTSAIIEIPVAHECVAIIDAVDADLAKLPWRLWAQDGQRYALSRGHTIKSEGPHASLHRVIMARVLGAVIKAPGACVDHINGDGLDNRRCNLRLATTAQNAANRGATSLSTSGYKGVTFHRKVQKWQASLKVTGRSLYLGVFHNIHEAAVAYDLAALRIHGEFARTNYSYPSAKEAA